MYLHGKQTIVQISESTGLSASTITRRLASVSLIWDQPKVIGCGVVHLDATYFGRNTGVLLALESGTGRLLYMKHIAHEHISDYEEAVRHIVGCGYLIHGIVIDGLQKLFVVFDRCPVSHGGDSETKTDQESAAGSRKGATGAGIPSERYGQGHFRQQV